MSSIWAMRRLGRERPRASICPILEGSQVLDTWHLGVVSDCAGCLVIGLELASRHA